MRNIFTNDSWLTGMIDFIFPPICIGCGNYSEDKYSICDGCRKLLDKQENPYCLNCLNDITPVDSICGSCGEDSFPLLAFASYKSPLTEIIKQFKFKGITKPSYYFADSIVGEYNSLFSDYEPYIFVPIPLYSTRENYRGYNQATILSEHLAQLLNIDSNNQILKRIKKRKPQSQLAHKKRKSNIKNVFEVIKNDIDNNIVLVDDVVTTGQTVYEAKKVLNRAGHKVVGVVAIAHAM
jgi:ComF family protein